MAREVIEDLIQAGKFAARVTVGERREGARAFHAALKAGLIRDAPCDIRKDLHVLRSDEHRPGRGRRVNHRLAADSAPEEFNSSPLPSQSPILMAYISGEMMPSGSSPPPSPPSLPALFPLSFQRGPWEGATNSIFHESPISSGCDRTFCGGEFSRNLLV